VSVVGDEHDEQRLVGQRQRLRSRVPQPQRHQEAWNLLRLRQNRHTGCELLKDECLHFVPNSLCLTRSCQHDSMLTGGNAHPWGCAANSAPSKPHGRRSRRPTLPESICWAARQVSAWSAQLTCHQCPQTLACLPYGAVIPELRAAAAISPAVIMAQDPYMTHRCMSSHNCKSRYIDRLVLGVRFLAVHRHTVICAPGPKARSRLKSFRSADDARSASYSRFSATAVQCRTRLPAPSWRRSDDRCSAASGLASRAATAREEACAGAASPSSATSCLCAQPRGGVWRSRSYVHQRSRITSESR